jgi:predicted nucleic acid-binding protein
MRAPPAEQMRVFPDTNVVAGGFATRRPSADVVRLLLAEHELTVGEVVLGETRRVLTETFGVPAETADEIERLLRRRHVEPVPDADPPVEVRNLDDELALASAIAAEADILITGDKELSTLRTRSKACRASLRIVTTRTF